MSKIPHVEKLGIILEPTPNFFENTAVLNPGVYQDGEFVHVFYRAIGPEMKSSIGYAKLKGPTEVVERWDKPIIERSAMYEMMGAEDPRITEINGRYYMTYVAHDGKNALGALATSWDLKRWQKQGIISPQITYDEIWEILRSASKPVKDQYLMFKAFYEEFGGKDIFLWEKDMMLFPKKISAEGGSASGGNGKFAMLHRILPDIQIIYFDSFRELQSKDFWIKYLENLADYVVLENKYWFETRSIGGGAPPIETKDGWLIIFHSTAESNSGRIYRASAALLDKDDPTKVIGRLDEPLFSPEEEWEKTGFVNNVVFPTGTAQFGDDLYIYYGAADGIIAVAKTNLNQLLKTLKESPPLS